MVLCKGYKGEELKRVMIMIKEAGEKCCEHCRMIERDVRVELEMIENFNFTSLIRKGEKLEKFYIDEENIRKCNPEWVCPSCTYTNPGDSNSCQMCGSPKPSN